MSRVVKEHVCVIHVHVGNAASRVSHRVPWRGHLSPDSLVTRTLMTLDEGPPGQPVVTPSSAEAPLPTVTEVTVTAGYNSHVSRRDTVEPTTPTGDGLCTLLTVFLQVVPQTLRQQWRHRAVPFNFHRRSSRPCPSHSG